jgi:hypothetical protein
MMNNYYAIPECAYRRKDKTMIERTPKVQGFLDNFAKKSFGKTQAEAEKEAKCMFCGKKVTGFKDALSRKEYGVSGMCQKCQDGVDWE